MEVDAVSILQQGHVVEIVDKGEVPRVGGIDLVVGGHLHPLLEIGENGYALHRRYTATDHHDIVVIVVVVGVPATSRRPRVGAGGRILEVRQPKPGFLRRRRGGRLLQLADLFFVEGFSGVEPAFLLPGVVVERDPKQ